MDDLAVLGELQRAYAAKDYSAFIVQSRGQAASLQVDFPSQSATHRTNVESLAREIAKSRGFKAVVLPGVPPLEDALDSLSISLSNAEPVEMSGNRRCYWD